MDSAPRIARISIRNFRGIAELDLDFCGPDGKPNDLVVLAGPNGCGKTAVLEACLGCVGCAELARRSLGSDAVRAGCDGFTVNADIIGGGVSLKCNLTHLGPSEELEGRVRWDSATKQWRGRARVAYFSSWRSADLVGAVTLDSSPSKRVSTTLPKELADWFVSEVPIGQRSAAIRDAIKAMFDRQVPVENSRLASVKQALVQLAAHEALGKKGRPKGVLQLQSVLGQLDTAWLVLRPGSSGSFEVGPVGDDPESGFDLFRTTSGGGRLSVDNLSSGELEVLSFFGWMLVKGFERGIILIDEPELHLDPQWHVPVLNAMRALQPESQFIVATHSPAIYDAAQSYERHLLLPDDDPRSEVWTRPVAEGRS
ncbi:MAG: AAA family ATPase [Planctomycetota bacterium]